MERQVSDDHCSHCEILWRNMLMLDPSNYIQNTQCRALMKEYLHCLQTAHKPDDKLPHHVGNGKPTGIFAGTLTMAPTDATNENEMCNSIIKIMTQKTCPVKRYAWYKEYTDKQLPHIHFIYETEAGGRIHAKVFKRYWKTWDEKIKQGNGHRGGYHKLVDSETAYTEYIEKDGLTHVNKWTT